MKVLISVLLTVLLSSCGQSEHDRSPVDSLMTQDYIERGDLTLLHIDEGPPYVWISLTFYKDEYTPNNFICRINGRVIVRSVFFITFEPILVTSHIVEEDEFCTEKYIVGGNITLESFQTSRGISVTYKKDNGTVFYFNNI